MQDTYDECPRVIEFTNGACFAAEASVPSADTAIDGWYRGPFSRCIGQSARFGRNGYFYSGSKPSADCYRMECAGGALRVIIDGVPLACPDGGYIRLDDYPGAWPWCPGGLAFCSDRCCWCW